MFSYLEVLQRNVLYVTHQVDYIRKEVRLLNHDKNLQNTVDKYFDEREETSPQTDSDEQ